MLTFDEYRTRYARASREELLELLAIEETSLTPAARQALAEEVAHRGLDPRAASAPPVVVSPPGQRIYPKAPVAERFGAYLIDSLIGMGPVIMAWVLKHVFDVATETPGVHAFNYLATIAWAIYYGFTKDARPHGQSVGKKMFGLMVVDVDNDTPCGLGKSIGRALVPVGFSIIPFIGWLIEPIAVLANSDGRRIGDRAASTQVIRASAYDAIERTREKSQHS